MKQAEHEIGHSWDPELIPLADSALSLSSRTCIWTSMPESACVTATQ